MASHSSEMRVAHLDAVEYGKLESRLEAAISALTADDVVDNHSESKILPLIRLLYLRARRVLKFARAMRVCNVPSVYISRQALRLVLLLNGAVSLSNGPNDQQLAERNELQSQIILLEKEMKIWGGNLPTGDEPATQEEYKRRVQEMEKQHDVFFKKRFYFEATHVPSKDTVFPKLLSYDRKSAGLLGRTSSIRSKISDMQSISMPGGISEERRTIPTHSAGSSQPLSETYPIMEAPQKSASKRPREHDFEASTSTGGGMNLAPEEELERARRFGMLEVQEDEDEETLRCPVPGCGRTFVKENLLKYHVNSEHQDKPYRCQTGGCDRRFSTRPELTSHRALHRIRGSGNVPEMPAFSPPLSSDGISSAPGPLPQNERVTGGHGGPPDGKPDADIQMGDDTAGGEHPSQ